jgi:hypothetical protein
MPMQMLRSGSPLRSATSIIASMGRVVLALRQLRDEVAGIAKRAQLPAIGQRDRVGEGERPRHQEGGGVRLLAPCTLREIARAVVATCSASAR